jgi:hypothetical protein
LETTWAYVGIHSRANSYWISSARSFVFSDPTASTPNADPTQIWRSMSVLRKFAVFAMIPLNTWIPFALGQAGVAWMVAAGIRGQDFGFIDVLRVVLRSARSLVPLFFLLTFLWIPAHAMMFIPGLVLAIARSRQPSNPTIVAFRPRKLFIFHLRDIVALTPFALSR